MARRAVKSSLKVNFKGVETRKTPPEGDYVVSVLEAKSGKSTSQNEQIEWVLEIARGEYKGVKLWFYTTLDEKSLWKLAAFLTALGEDVPEDDMDIDLPDLIGKECVAVLTHETYNGKKRAKMTDFDSLENYKGDDDDDTGKKGKKDKKSKSDDEDDDKPAKKSKKDKKSDDEDEPKKGKKDKGKKDKKPKLLDPDDVEEMDEDELQALVDEHDLEVELEDIKKLPKKVAAVLKALKKAKLLADDE